METENTNAIDFKLDFKYSESNARALKDVSDSVKKGKCVVLCGSSGCGKSTLLRCINQLIPKFYEGDLKGFVNIFGKDTKNLSIGDVGRMAASVFQDPRSQFFTLNSSSEIAFGLENFGFSKEEIQKRVNGTFKDFNLEYLKGRNVFELSSGERQIIAILAARALNTDLYILDEPTANLDFDAVEKLEELLITLKNQGKTLFISEHRLYYLSSVADEFWLMEQGEIKEKYTCGEIKNFDIEVLNSLGLRTSDISKIKPDKKLYQGENSTSGSHTSQLDIKNICYKYKRNGKNVLENLSAKAKTGEVIGLIGHNGCGKTTLGKVICGLYKSKSGTLEFDGKKQSPKQLSEKSIFIMQEAEFQFFTNSVTNELCYGLYGKEREKRKEEIKPLLKETELWKCRNQHPFSLSGGQMQKLVLLLAYFSKKPIAVLDEPTAGLDYKSLCKCVTLIKEMQKEKIVFIISHDPELLSKVCTRALFIDSGQVKKEINLLEKDGFSTLLDLMQTRIKKDTKFTATDKKCKKREIALDPRTKILLFIFSMIAGIGTKSALILPIFAVIMLVFLYERRFLHFICGSILMSAIYILYFNIKNVFTAFLISFFPRVIIICFAALLLMGEKNGERTVASLRLLHVPEKVIMVFSVTFRFFPVLKKGLGIMSQSLKTRGFFKSFKEKIKAFPEYLEILVVPTVFRVIRIADSLSSSAETRGIAQKNKRYSFISLKMTFADILFIIISIISLIAGFIY